MNIRRNRSKNIRFVADWDIDFPLRQDPEENLKERLQLLLIYGLIAIDIQQIEDILDIILRGIVEPHEVGNHLDHLGELKFREPPVTVLVKLLEDLLDYSARVSLRQLPLPARHFQ